jgi:hypothetical protein
MLVAESRCFPEIFLEVPWNTPKNIRTAAVPVENRIRNLKKKRPERYHYTKLHGLLLMTLRWKSDGIYKSYHTVFTAVQLL